jgi:hypothetical protein
MRIDARKYGQLYTSFSRVQTQFYVIHSGPSELHVRSACCSGSNNNASMLSLRQAHSMKSANHANYWVAWQTIHATCIHTHRVTSLELLRRNTRQVPKCIHSAWGTQRSQQANACQRRGAKRARNHGAWPLWAPWTSDRTIAGTSTNVQQGGGGGRDELLVWACSALPAGEMDSLLACWLAWCVALARAVGLLRPTAAPLVQGVFVLLTVSWSVCRFLMYNRQMFLHNPMHCFW